MAKSLGNFISVEDGVQMFRADVLRLWVLSVDYRDQIGVSADYIRKNMVDAYRRIRNTFRFLLGNVSDFDPARHAVPYADMPEMDRWALDETARLVTAVERAWEGHELHRVYSLVHNFCAVQMSSIYLDALKDRLYCSAAGWQGRRSAQSVLHQVLLVLCKLCAPVLVHTAEEVWSHIQYKDEDLGSVHLSHWPRVPNQWLDEQLHERWERILAVRDDVARAVEALRERKTVANSMEVSLAFWASEGALRSILQDARDTVQELLMVSELAVLDEEPAQQVLAEMACGQREPGLMIRAVRSEYAKCARCWNRRPSVGQDRQHPELCDRCVRAVQEQQR